MPFTPFHMGPGLFIKGLFQGAFSLVVFGWAQIVMDIQPLIVLVTGEGHLHGFSHTYVGATLLAVFSTLSGKYLGEWGLRFLHFKEVFLRWWVVALSAFVGTYSHVLLDSLMHADLQPFYPFNLDNPFLRLVSVATLHKICIFSGLIGGIVMALVLAYQRWKSAGHL